MQHSLSENHRLRRLYLLPRARVEKLSPHAAALLQMISSKTSRPASRRSVPLASDLGLTPMTLGLRDLHLERPHRRDRRYRAALARHFVLCDSELVALAGPDHELALAAFSDLAGDGIVEEAVLQTIDDKPFETVEGLADLSTLGLESIFYLSHCATVPSYP